MIFRRFSRYFQSSQLLSSIVPVVFTLGPLDFCFLLSGGPWSGEEQRRERAAFPGEERLRRWGPHWGKARGAQELPLEGLGARDGGLWWPRRGEGRPAADWSAAAAFPAGLGGGEQVGEHQRSVGELSGGRLGARKAGGMSSAAA